MAIVTTNAGELELLNKMLKEALVTDDNYILKLYKNDYTPTDNSTSSSFVEADFTNYVAATLTRANWNSAVTVGNKAESSYGSSPLSWTCGTTGNTVYGYYVSSQNTGTVLWAERFDNPVVLADGYILMLTPKMSLDRSP